MEETEFITRTLPHSRELEEAVLSACLQDPQWAMPIALDITHTGHFYYEPHLIIWEACVVLHRKGNPPDPLSVIAELRRVERLDLAGGESYVYQLFAAVPNASAVETHCRLLAEKWMRRVLIARCNHILGEAYGYDCETEALIDEAEKLILSVDDGTTGGDFVDLDMAMREYFDEFTEVEITDADGTKRNTLRRPPGVSTGFRDIDRILGGFYPQDFIVLGARPSMGKTALALNFAFHAASKGTPVGFFSLEMSNKHLAGRLLSNLSGVPAERLKLGGFSEPELTALSGAYTMHTNLPLYFDESTSLTIRSLRNRARRMVHRHQVKLLVVDYLQLMSGGREYGGKDENRVAEFTRISQGLKGLARELKIPVLVCSQLSRQTERRAEARPRLSDLRESGAIEQDADVAMLMYRPDYYEQRGVETLGIDTKCVKVEVNIAKNRNGGTGMVCLAFLRDFLRFEQYTGEEVNLEH